MPLYYDDFFEELISKQHELFLAACPHISLGEQEHSEIATAAVEQMRSEMRYYKHDILTFAERMTGRDLTFAEKMYFFFMQNFEVKSVPIEYRPYEFESHLLSENDPINIQPLFYLCSRGHGSHLPVPMVTTTVMKVASINKNKREFAIDPTDNLPSIGKFLEDLPFYYSFPDKNEPEDLQLYKDIIYPWDDKFNGSLEAHHRIEIGKSIGDSNYDFHKKSGRHNRKRSKVV